MEESYSKVEWILYAVILPLLFTVVLGGVVLEFLGVDVINRVSYAVSHSSVVEHFLTPGKPSAKQQLMVPRDRLTAAENEIQKLEQAKAALQAEVTNQQTTAEQAQSDVKKLMSELASVKAASANYDTEATVLTAMSPDSAAAIISAMPVDQAEQVLLHMKTDDRASVLQKMDPKLAAGFMSQVLNQTP